MRIILALFCLTALCAGESAAVVTWKKAMAGDDGTAKRDATRALADDSAGKNAEILPLLIEALRDRQAARWASEALQKRTGLVKPSKERNGPGFPGYPQTDDAAGWSAWLSAWEKDNATKSKIDQLTNPGAPATDTPAGAAASEVPGSDSTEQSPGIAPPPRIPTEDLGKLDRIVYKSGRSLTAYVRSKRLDGDGNLISVRVVHRDGAGEEVIEAAVIARIEDDVE
jgi:hypothetical protein